MQGTSTSSGDVCAPLKRKMKFTDMNIDCIESCLEHLKLDDLLNAAASNKRLNRAASFIYHRSYSTKLIHLNIVPGNRSLQFRPNSRIEFCNLMSSLRLLRCFGNLIKNILISYKGVYKIVDDDLDDIGINNYELTLRAIEYLNEYCTESSTLIQFNKLKNVPVYLKEQFKHVTKLQMVDCDFTELVENNSFNAIFPRTEEFFVSITDSILYPTSSFKFMANHFPFLERLHIRHSDRYLIETRSLKQSLTAAIHLNPQLKQLTIKQYNSFFDANFLQSVNNSLKNLEFLGLSMDEEFNSKANGELIQFKNLKTLEIYIQSSAESFQIPFAIDKLEVLVFAMNVRLTNFSYEFIEKHPYLTNLTLHAIKHEHAINSRINVSRIANSLPLLEKLKFAMNINITIDEILPHCTKFKSLNEMSFCQHGNVEVTALKPFESIGWSGTVERMSQKTRINLKRIKSE
ncbi:uncharacterized protein LOC116338225 [Contarinia nasturtii]|uniref:uncharacterized protein LOC116338225 n=1 Tax=Contarinia nasturtii TaxID=265458 RepID=UPI0012D48FB0|nr:uncharacterized protein LOC116338225 [Contarinia nasturtii]